MFSETLFFLFPVPIVNITVQVISRMVIIGQFFFFLSDPFHSDFMCSTFLHLFFFFLQEVFRSVSVNSILKVYHFTSKVTVTKFYFCLHVLLDLVLEVTIVDL